MSSRAFRSSATQLALLYVCICALCVGGLLWTGLLITQRGLESEVDLVITTELDALRKIYDEGGFTRLVDALKRRADSWGRPGAVYLLADAANNPIAGNLSAWPPQWQADDQWLEFDIIARERGQDVAHPVRAQVFKLDKYKLLLGTDVSERRRISARLRATTLWGIGFTTALSALIGWWYSRRIAARVRVAAQTCESVISGELMRRLPLNGSHDEFDQLAAAVNHMLDRIEQQTGAVRATFNSAAHDLRAPLHRIRVRLEAAVQHGSWSEAAREAINDSVGDLERVQRTLATLLQIAQADSAAGPGVEEPTDLVAIAHELVELYAPEARERGLSLTCSALGTASIRGNSQLLAQLLANLLENAIKYVPSGGHVEVQVQRTGASVLLIVRDDGPGIPEESRHAVLQPFHRLERDGGERDDRGSGLGLSLVAAVVRLHRGRLTLRDSQPGLEARCEFPAADLPQQRSARSAAA
ncbi:MAG: sensor histidine kinase [Steroidobacterales bacterium]